MRIQNNIMALNTHRSYTINNENVAKSAEKLSSGYRINRAGDDAAGLAISEKMRAQIRGLNMATKNSYDAISLVQTAEGALQETHNILQRMRELSVQSSSDTNEKVIDRGALQQEFAQLQKEIDDIADKTVFNDQKLINGTFQKTKSYLLTDGTTTAAFLAKVAGVSVERAKADVYTFNVTATAASDASVTASVAPGATFVTDTEGGTATNVTKNMSVAFDPTPGKAHNGASFTFEVTGSRTAAIVNLKDSSNNIVSSSAPVDLSTWNAAGDKSISFAGYGTLTVTVDAAGAAEVLNDDATTIDAFAGFMADAGRKLTFDSAGTDPVVNPAVKGSLTLSYAGESVTLYAGDTSANFVKTGIAISFNALSDASFASDTAAFGANTFDIGVGVNEGAAMIIQTGANQYDELAINIDAMNTGTLGVKYSSIDTRTNASRAITEVNDALNKVSTQRAALGALQNRLEHKIANLKVSSENLTAAESRIRDVDIASEMTNFTKNNILSQAATAMLAQANAAPQNVLSLLR